MVYISQAKAEPLHGRVERILTWRWMEKTAEKSRSSDSDDDLEDDVMQGEWI